MGTVFAGEQNRFVDARLSKSPPEAARAVPGRIVEFRPPAEAPVVVHCRLGDDCTDALETTPQGMPVVVYEIDDDATRARGAMGAVATGGLAEALIFHEPFDSGTGYFGYLVGSEIGNLHSADINFENWPGSGPISSYDILVYNSQLFSGPATVRLSL